MGKEPFYIMICDDEQEDRETIAEMTKQICKMEQIDLRISCFESGEELLQGLNTGAACNLILADVMMPQMDGMELARFLRREKRKVSIVFTSSNREMALRGYEVAADRYLAKPLKMEELREAICFCYGKLLTREEILLQTGKETKKIAPSEILYIEIKGRKIHIVLTGEEWDTPLSIDQVEKMLSNYGFVRCHQSFLVNCRYIRTLSASQIELKDGSVIPVSKHRIKDVRKSFFDYMEG